jgi:hypothetical protein
VSELIYVDINHWYALGTAAAGRRGDQVAGQIGGH